MKNATGKELTDQQNHLEGALMLKTSSCLRRLIVACRAGVVMACLILIAAPCVHAQLQNTTNIVQTPTPGSGHDYFKMLSETTSA
jgi:hypothetical protein